MSEQASRNETSRTPKLALIGFAIAWALNAAFAKWPGIRMAALIVACVLVTLLLTFLIAKKPKLKTLPWLTVLGLLAALAFPAWRTFWRRSATSSDLAAIRGIVSSEELILTLSPKLDELKKSVLNLRLTTSETFADSFVVHDLQNESDGNWKPGKAETLSRGAEIWSALISGVSYFDHAKLKVVRGDFPDSSQTTFETLVSFSGRARMKSGQWGGMHGDLTVTWKKEESAAWRIAEWRTQSFEVDRSDTLWFHESLAETLPRSGDLEKLRRSQHQEETIQFYQEGRKQIPHRYFTTISANQKPGIAVADIDSDGDDDIFVTVRRGDCKLLENQGDGTFIENAEHHGLNVKNHCTSALFADFDNDGDADLMLGRSLLPTIYFVNEGGKFRPIQSTNLPRLTISMAAADYDKDGLLDIYVCTYRPAVLGGSSPAGGVASDSQTWPDEFLSPENAKQYYERHAASRKADPNNAFPNLLNQLGPPNVLLRNLGNGQFAPVELPPEFDVWKNSLQATWSTTTRTAIQISILRTTGRPTTCSATTEPMASPM